MANGSLVECARIPDLHPTLYKMDAETAHACDSSNRSGEKRESGSEEQHLLYKAWGYPELCNIMWRNIRTNKCINWYKGDKMGEHIDDRYIIDINDGW